MDAPENNYQPRYHPYYREFTKRATSTIIMLTIATLAVLGVALYTFGTSAPTAILGTQTP